MHAYWRDVLFWLEYSGLFKYYLVNHYNYLRIFNFITSNIDYWILSVFNFEFIEFWITFECFKVNNWRYLAGFLLPSWGAFSLI